MNKENDLRYLYRGINLTMFEEARWLVPKGDMDVFNPTLEEVESLDQWDLSASKRNAVYEHQNDYERYNTCYVSTSKSFGIAKYFATDGGMTSGVVLTLNRSLFEKHGIEEHDLYNAGSSNEKEVSIRAKDNGTITVEVVFDKTHVDP
jgi:hypothetical protein